jgi:hypothetical protein
VSGGKFEYDYTFNYSRVESGKTINGYATGRCKLMLGIVISDQFNYSKKLDYGPSGYLVWQIVEQSVIPLTISNGLKVRRMEPFN